MQGRETLRGGCDLASHPTPPQAHGPRSLSRSQEQGEEKRQEVNRQRGLPAPSRVP